MWNGGFPIKKIGGEDPKTGEKQSNHNKLAIFYAKSIMCFC